MQQVKVDQNGQVATVGLTTRRWARTLAPYILLLVVVATGWCAVFGRLDAASWRLPVDYSGDALLVLARVKAAAEGHYWPVLPKQIPPLGAPFGANWDAHPTSEDLLYFTTGSAARVIGVMPAANAAVLLAFVLAAWSFYACARLLGCRREWSVLCALAFAWSSYAFFRNLRHVMLAYDWLIPPAMVLSMWLASRDAAPVRRSHAVIAVLLAFAIGLHNVYYWFLFLQCITLAAIVRVVRTGRWRALVLPSAIAAAAVAGFLAGNIDSLPYLLAHGRSTSLVRAYSDLDTFGLRPAMLLAAPPDHRWRWWAGLGSPFRIGEGAEFGASPTYAGLLALFGLAWLIAVSIVRATRRPARPLPPHAWLIMWIVLYSVPGGINTLLGMLGVTTFRSTGRYSIAIAALALLFMARQLTAVTRRWSPWLCAGVALLLSAGVAADQLPRPIARAESEATTREVASDRAFVSEVERRTPAGMVFQLPVMDFPEAVPIRSMGDYEHFRPYLFSTSLRFSYGDHKSNVTAAWPHDIEGLQPRDMVLALEQSGFTAIEVNRAGYADRGAQLLAGLREAGRTEVIESPKGDLACVLLTPSPRAQRPDVVTSFVPGWFPAERDATGRQWRWSRGNAKTALLNLTAGELVRELSFELATVAPRRVLLRHGAAVLADFRVVAGQAIPVNRLRVALPPGVTMLEWATDAPPAPAGNGDARRLAFAVYDFHIVRP